MTTLSRILPFLFAATAALAATQDRISLPVDAGHSIPLTARTRAQGLGRSDQGRVAPSLPIVYATLHLKPAPGLADFLAAQQDPSSPSYHRWLTPEQFGERFGVSPGDLAKVKAWLESEGLVVHDVARGRHWMTFSGSASDVGRAFHTEIHRYVVNGKVHFANATAPFIPAALAPVVAGVRGLDDFRLESTARGVPVSPAYDTATGHALSPSDYSTIFDLQRLYSAGIDGTGQSIAIIGQTAIHLSDIQAFRTRFNLPANDPKLVLYGADPGVSAADLGEADLDLQWSGAAAPNAQIYYVYSSDVMTSAQYAIDQNIAPVMSLSYGGCEDYDSLEQQAVAQQANAQGITWLASSGDSGAVTCDRNDATALATFGPTVSSPANLPEITAVGGTEFTDTTSTYWASKNNSTGGSALSYVPERAWNDFSSSLSFFGTGGGASSLFAKPAWQSGPGVPSDNARHVPDISLPASGTVPYLVVYNGVLYGFGGTSCSSPSMAGVIALLNQHQGGGGLGNINPALYRLAQSTTDVFHDITSSDNKAACEQGSVGCVNGKVGFSATTGYDMATGLGSIDVYNFVMEWAGGTASQTSLTVTPNGALNLTDTVQLVATVSGGGGAPTGTVTFVNHDIAVASAPLIAGNGLATATASVTAIQIASGNNTVTAVYSGDSVYQGSAGSARIALNIPTGQALVVPYVTPNPVAEVPAYSNWPYTLGMVEKGGVATSITSFTIGGGNALAFLGSNPKLAANGSLELNLASSNVSVPATLTFALAGADANGNKWSQSIAVPFTGPAGTVIAPGLLLTSPLTTVQQNPLADSSCQWALPIAVQETGGYPIVLSALTAGSSSLTSQMETIFGTQRLAPYGMLHGTVCFSGTTTPTVKSLQISGTTTLSTTVTSTLSTSFAAASLAPVTMSVGVNSLALSAAAQGSTTGLIPVNFSSGAPQWTATVSPANRTTAWLTLNPSGTASGTSPLNVQASATNLSPGVYTAIVNIQATDVLPQVLQVPVTFTVAGSATTSIAGVGNAWSGSTTGAPGMILSVYGTALANSTSAATTQPLPLSIGGVSATVNGFAAPLYYVSPGQINLQAPYEAGAGAVTVAIDNNGQIASFPLTTAPSAPGLYSSAISNSTGQLVSTEQAGSTDVLLLFVTGEGDVTPTLPTGTTPASTITDATKLPHTRLPLALTIGGVTVTPDFAGIPSGLVGTTQIDFRVPATAPVGKQPVIVTVGGVASQPVYLTITAPSGQ